jgi:chromosomal replication initiation ATPase DnaA
MSVKKEVELLIADTERAISTLTGCHSKLTLFLTVDTSEKHELVIAACDIWKVDVATLSERNRHTHYVERRQLLAWLLRDKTLLSLRQIAAHVGYAGHYDVMHGMQKAQSNVSVNDPITMSYYEPIKHLFEYETV